MIPDDERLPNSFACIIPAQPGWFVAWYWVGGLTPEPIIAWEIRRSRKNYHRSLNRGDETVVHCLVTPITIGGRQEDGDWVIRHPDGSYELPSDRFFENEAEVIAFFKEEHEAKEERQKKTLEDTHAGSD